MDTIKNIFIAIIIIAFSLLSVMLISISTTHTILDAEAYTIGNAMNLITLKVRG